MPALPTIPEDTEAATLLGSPPPLYRKNSPKYRKYRSQQHPHIWRLQLCLVLFTPVYTIISSLLIVRHRAFRSPSHLGFHQHQYFHGMALKDTIEKGSQMSRKRIVIIPSNYQQVLDATSITITAPLDDDGTAPSMLQQQDVSPNDEKGSTIETQHTECVPTAEWQTMSFPTCNSVHEMDIFSSSTSLSSFHRHNGSQSQSLSAEDVLIHSTHSARILSHGWFRHSWSVSDLSGEEVAIKTLR